MPQIVHVSSVVAAATDEINTIIQARRDADGLAANYGLTVADMPLAIRAMAAHSKVRKAIMTGYADTISVEHHGLREGRRSYEVWHSAGSLATTEGLYRAEPNRVDYGFMQIANDEWVGVGAGVYKGKCVARIHLDDVKKGNVPAAGTPYTVFVLIDEDAPNINAAGQLNYDSFMRDDRVLMVAGSPENREALAKMFFGSEAEGGKGLNSVGSRHRINEPGFFNGAAKGRLTSLNARNYGIGGDSYIPWTDATHYINWRFIAVALNAQRAPSNIIGLGLEDIVTVAHR